MGSWQCSGNLVVVQVEPPLVNAKVKVKVTSNRIARKKKFICWKGYSVLGSRHFYPSATFKHLNVFDGKHLIACWHAFPLIIDDQHSVLYN